VLIAKDKVPCYLVHYYYFFLQFLMEWIGFACTCKIWLCTEIHLTIKQSKHVSCHVED